MHRIRWWQVAVSMAGGLLLALLALAAVLRFDFISSTRGQPARTPSILFTDRNGRLLLEVIDPNGSKHLPLPLADIPLTCQQATIATEDSRFYSHPGVDLVAVVRAAWGNLRWKSPAEQTSGVFSGASTLTQQLARNLYMPPDERYERSLKRKLREAWLAWGLEREHSKDEILALYLNSTYYGHFATGMEAAAQAYFGVHAHELDLAQCALLAGLPQNPTGYNPIENADASRWRQGVVLDLMVRDGHITRQQAREARGERLVYASTPFPIDAPHFVMWVQGEVQDRVGAEAYRRGGLKVTTTLDLDAQHRAEEIVQRRLALLRPCTGEAGAGSVCDHAADPSRRIENAALVAIEPESGAVLAMVGSPDYFEPRISGAVNAALSARQPGSAIKPITYAVALDPERASAAGRPVWTGATIIPDLRTAFPTREGRPYVPLNYDLEFHGPVQLRSALANSYNIPAVRTLQHIGVDALVEQASRMGIDWRLTAGGRNSVEGAGGDAEEGPWESASGYGLALTLGGGEVRLLDLTAAYGAFANGGRRVRPFGVSRIETLDGEILFEAESRGAQERVLDPRVAYLITDILSDEAARRPAFGKGNVLEIGRAAAAKTGTTTDWRDNWTIGYVPGLVAGVWVGNADNTPMRDVSGITGAGPIWHQFMTDLLRDQPVRRFPTPDGLVQVEICADSGLLPAKPDQSPANDQSGRQDQSLRIRDSGGGTIPCPYRRLEWFIAGTEPTETDATHRVIAIDLRTGRTAEDLTPAEAIREQTYWVLGEEYRAWARENGIPQPPEAETAGARIAAGVPGSSGSAPKEERQASGSGIRLTSPDRNRVYRLDPRLPAELQRVAITAVPDAGIAANKIAVVLLLDGEPMGPVEGPEFTTWWQLRAGRHTFQAVATRPGGQDLTSDMVTVTVE